MSATPPANTCPPCNCNCGDSPLSITGNVIGIVTFIYVLLVGLEYRRTSLARAYGDIQNIFREATIRLITLEYWEERNKVVGGEGQGMAQEARDVLKSHYDRLHQLASPTLARDTYYGLVDARKPSREDPDFDLLERLRTYRIAAHGYKLLELWQMQQRPMILWLSWRFIRERDRLREELDKFDSYMERAKTLQEVSEWKKHMKNRGDERDGYRTSGVQNEAEKSGAEDGETSQVAVNGETAKRMQDIRVEVPETTVTNDKPATPEISSAAQPGVIDEGDENRTPDPKRKGDDIV